MKRRDKEMVMDGETIERALLRITHEILERNRGVKDLVLIGIRTGGVYLAERIREKIDQIEKVKVPSGIIDITLYRDDFSIGLPRPLVVRRRSPLPSGIKGSSWWMMCCTREEPSGRRWTL